MGAPDCRRCARHAPGHRRPQTRFSRPRQNRRDSDRARHDSDADDALSRQAPSVRFSIVSKTSIDVLRLLDDLEVDAGLTYLDNEPVGRVNTVPLYYEEYRLLTSPAGAFGDRDSVTWAEVGQVPLCLLTPDMQNRRIIDALLRSAGQEPSPTLESNSMIVLFAHVRTGKWASIMPAKSRKRSAYRQRPLHPDCRTGGDARRRSDYPHREPMTPLITATRNRGSSAGQGLGPSAGSDAKCKRKQTVRRTAEKA